MSVWNCARICVVRGLSFLVMSTAIMTPVGNAQSGSITGVIVRDSTGQPLSDAEVALVDVQMMTRSDSSGRYVLNGVPAGQHKLTVRLVGYESFTVDVSLGSAQTVADVVLKSSVSALTAVAVTASANAPFAVKLAEFDERRKSHAGKFITGDVFDREGGRPASSIITAHIAGVRIVQTNGHHYLSSTRGNVAAGGRAFSAPSSVCYMQVIVNGRVTYNGSAGQEPFDIDELNSQDIIGFEYYTVATTPQQYNGTSAASACGTVVIWTKAG